MIEENHKKITKMATKLFLFFFLSISVCFLLNILNSNASLLHANNSVSGKQGSAGDKQLSNSQLLLKAQKQFRNGNSKNSASAFSGVLKNNPQNVMALLGRSAAYLSLKEYEKAKADLTAVIKLQPKKAPYYIRRSHLSALQQKYSDAIADLTYALKLNPRDAQSFFHRANIYTTIGKRELALNDFSKSMKFAPNVAESYIRRGKIYWLIGCSLAAVRDFTTVLQNIIISTSESNCNLGLLTNNTAGKGSKGIVFKLTKLQMADAYLHRAYSYGALNKYEEAIDDYKKVIDLKLFLPKALLGRAVLYKKYGKFKPAIDDYNKVVQLRPNWAVAHFNRANALREIGQEAEATKAYNRVISITSKEIAALEKKNAAKQKTAANTKTISLRLNPVLFVTRAKAYLAIRNNKKAIANFTTAYNYYKKNGDEMNEKKMLIAIEKASN